MARITALASTKSVNLGAFSPQTWGSHSLGRIIVGPTTRLVRNPFRSDRPILLFGARSDRKNASSGTFIEGSGSALYDFVNGTGGGSYVITNFRPGTDASDLYGYTPGQQAISIGPASTVLSLSDGSKTQLLGVTDLGHSIIG